MDCILEAARKSNNLTRKLQAKLQTLSLSHRMGGFKSGRRLSPRHLKYANPQLAMASNSYGCIFARDTEGLALDTNVYLVVDASGSMSSRSGHMTAMEHASAAALMLWQSLTALQIPVAITCFTTQLNEFPISEDMYNGVLNLIVSEFNEKTTPEEIVKRFRYCESRMYNNADADSIGICYAEHIQTPQRRKIMIVLSDGEPCGGVADDEDQLLIDMVTAITLEKRVEIYGIGIDSPVVERYYPNWYLLDDPAELEVGLLKIIESIIIK